MACKLAVAIALLGCLCLASAQVDPQGGPKRRLGLINGLYEVTGGNPNAVGIGSYWAIVETKGGKEVNGAGALLNRPLLGAPAGTLVGPATPLNGNGDWVDITYNQYPTWRFTVSLADGTALRTANLVQVSENLLLTFPVGTAIPNPPTAAAATSVLTRVGQVLSVKGDKWADAKGDVQTSPKNATKDAKDDKTWDKPAHAPKNHTKPDHEDKPWTKPDQTPKNHTKVEEPKAPKNTTKGKN